jgi:xylulokinase
MLCLGLDSGRTTCKGLVLEADFGKVLAQAGAPHSFVDGPPRGHIEQDPQKWCDAAERVIQTCLEKIGERRNDRVRDLFRWEMDAFEKNIARSQPGANGLTFLPYFDGERLPNLPNRSGVIHGLHSTNTNRHDIARALVEGIVVGLAQGMKRLLDLGIHADELRITGGGAKSATMCQIVSDIFGMPVMGFKVAERAALGAAIQAAWTYGQTRGDPMPLEKIVKSAVKSNRKTRPEPRKENETLYAELRGRHADLTQRLASSGYL